MLKRGYKLIICVVLVSALFIGFGSAYASAESAIVTRLKATVAAALLASNLVMEPVNVALDTLSYSVVDPMNKLEWNETLPEYLDKSTIKIVADHALIDDQYYSLVWLGPEAANSLRLKGFDFTTAYDILSNQSEAVKYAEGVGYSDGLPIYRVDNVLQSPKYSVEFPLSDSSSYAPPNHYSIGLANFDLSSIQDYSSSVGIFYQLKAKYSFSSNYNTIGNSKSGDGFYGLYQYNSSSVRGNLFYTDVQGRNQRTELSGNLPVSNAPFSYDYTSGIIDAPISPEDGLLLQIPSSYSDPDNPQYNYDIHDLINIYPQVTQDHGAPIEIDPDLNPDFQTDIDLGNSVGDLIRIILSILDLLDHTTVEFAPEPESPQPGPVDPDPAIPDTPVSDQDGTWLDELLRWIKHAIDVLHQDLADVLDLLDTQLTEIYHELEQNFDAIREWMENIPDVIKHAHAKGMKDAIGALKKIVLPLLAPIKALMNLWHYVVEWFTSINAPFLWIFGIMSGTSYNLVLPIYASLAGVICIAIYKSFGR